MTKLNSKVPKGPIKDKWTTYKDKINLVNPANKRNIDVIVVGTGLAGGSASATLFHVGAKAGVERLQERADSPLVAAVELGERGARPQDRP